ncbi:hypothetical protein U0070_003987 [Myodes glareolus]|uniref:Uncharacterized protein n=1 Tax=Myodes glareolus TaxID=447135 RepID=A0AAW0KDK7_MYOGA
MGRQNEFNPSVTSDQSKNREWHFNAPSHIQRMIKASPLSKELRGRSTMFHLCPFERMMKFRLSEGTTKASKVPKIGKVVQLYMKNVIYIERVQREG